MTDIRRNRVQAMLDDETYDALVKEVKAEGKTVSNFVLEAIKEKLGL